MVQGNQNALSDPNAIVISESYAKTLFGDAEPIGKSIKLNNEAVVTVRGVFKDLPSNMNAFETLAAFSEIEAIDFIAPWEVYVSMYEWVKTAKDQNLWDRNSYQIYIQVHNTSTLSSVSDKIKNTLYDHVPEVTQKVIHNSFFIP